MSLYLPLDTLPYPILPYTLVGLPAHFTLVISKRHLDRKVPIRSALPGCKTLDLKAGKYSLRRYDNHEGMQRRQQAESWKRHLVPSTAQSCLYALFY